MTKLVPRLLRLEQASVTVAACHRRGELKYYPELSSNTVHMITRSIEAAGHDRFHKSQRGLP